MTIKQQLINHLESNMGLCYGTANTLTKSQSGSRRLREELVENHIKYRFIRVKGENGAYFNVFARSESFEIRQNANGYYVRVLSLLDGWYRRFFYTVEFSTKKEAESQIKEVVR